MFITDYTKYNAYANKFLLCRFIPQSSMKYQYLKFTDDNVVLSHLKTKVIIII